MTNSIDPASPENIGNQNVNSIEAPAVRLVPPRLASSRESWAWVRRFLACNPLYPLSAALLLYSFCLISGDVHFFKSDITRLSFNLGSLQFYEVLVVVTAIWLARRTVWYDSTLLAILENMLLLVPFILLSEAALINSATVWILSVAAALIALTRLSLLRRFYRELNFPRRLLIASAIMLGANAALLVVYRVLHATKVGKQPDWGAAYEMNQYAWWVILPPLCSIGAFVPICRNMVGNTWPKRSWLPITFYALWLVGTCVHLYSLGYVYDFALRPDLVAPGLWMLTWVVWLKVMNLVPELRPDLRVTLWAFPALATLFAFGQPEKVVFLGLTGINVVAFALLFLRYRTRAALHFTLVSAVALMAGLPEAWGRHLVTNFSREMFIGGAAALYALICTTVSRNPKIGLLGACITGILTGVAGSDHPGAGFWAAQNSLAYLLIHSLRWHDREEPGTGALRWLAAFLWVTIAIAWTLEGRGGSATLLVAGIVFACGIAAWLFWKVPLRPAIVVACAGVTLTSPTVWVATHVKESPTWLLTLLGSFLLFGLGTLAALTKHRWLSTNGPARVHLPKQS